MRENKKQGPVLDTRNPNRNFIITGTGGGHQANFIISLFFLVTKFKSLFFHGRDSHDL